MQQNVWHVLLNLKIKMNIEQKIKHEERIDNLIKRVKLSPTNKVLKQLLYKELKEYYTTYNEKYILK